MNIEYRNQSIHLLYTDFYIIGTPLIKTLNASIILQTFIKSIMQFIVSGKTEVNTAKANIDHSLLKIFCY